MCIAKFGIMLLWQLMDKWRVPVIGTNILVMEEYMQTGDYTYFMNIAWGTC